MLGDCRNADGGEAVRRGRTADVGHRGADIGRDGRRHDVEVTRPVVRGDEDVRSWPDARLVDAVRAEPPDAAALDALVARYWAPLHARCELLTLDREVARDIAQETWLRVLRARTALQPDANFVGYLMTIATNLCRDRHRSARRAGPLADARLASLDDAATGADDAPILSNVIADPDRLPPDEQLLLRIDLDRALACLEPRAREVLIARYVDGESAAEIGARFGRTEQTVTTWLRNAIREIRVALASTAEL